MALPSIQMMSVAEADISLRKTSAKADMRSAIFSSSMPVSYTHLSSAVFTLAENPTGTLETLVAEAVPVNTQVPESVS